MSVERKGIELYVGLFLLAGFAVIAVMVLMFGRFSQGFSSKYDITVEFPNASGIIKGSDVLLSGARIGNVAQNPRLVPERYSVTVQLDIRGDVKIPRTSYFQIRSNGMLGDSYVDVMTPVKYTPNDIAQPGEQITGTRSSGFDDLTAKGTEMIDKLNSDILKKLSEELDALKVATTNVNERLLSEKNLQNVEVTFENLRSVSKEFVSTSKELDDIMVKAKSAVESAQGTMKTIDTTANELKGAIGDFRKMADTSKTLLTKIDKGEGTLGMLISDRQTAENTKALISNLRRSGVLFYKDRPVDATSAPQSAAKKKTR